MSDVATAELEQLGRDAARLVAGDAAVAEVEVVAGESADRPAYFFSFLIDPDRATQRLGLIHTRLVQRLRDELIARNDAHYPVIRLLDRADWGKRAGA